jgi:hypothetical protein
MKRIFSSLESIGNDIFRRRMLRRQRGSIMVLTSVLIMGMVGMLALAIDLGFLFSAKNQFQNGIDAAAVAGGTGLRVTMELDPAAPEQAAVAKSLAVQYAGYNQVRRFADPDPNSGQPNANDIVLTAGEVTIDPGVDIPQVRINTAIQTPLLFAGIFGFNSMNITTTATASLLPVDGGTGSVGSGTSIGGGCWRPLFLPDTFYDSSDTPIIVGPTTGPPRLPNQLGDYYRSRFATGARNAFPFIDSYAGGGSSVTGLRDTGAQSEIGVRTIMGQYVTFDHNYYFIANLSGLPRSTYDVLSPGDLARFGYCGKIRVGDDIPVYSISDVAVYDQVRIGLTALKSQTLDSDSVDANIETNYRYVTSSSYPGPNTHAAIIPVMFYNPIIWKDPGTITSVTTLKVTNFGLFFLKQVNSNGDISGFFVREIVGGGTPIDATNMSADIGSAPNWSFKRSWLPMSVQLLK